MTYFLNIFLRASPEKPFVLKKIKIIKTQKSKSFLLGVIIAAFLFVFSSFYRERHTLWRLIAHRLRGRRKIQESNTKIALPGDREYCCQCSYLEAFLKTYQPEVAATLIYVLQMAGISLETYFEALEVESDWPKFQRLMGEVSLMVMEKARIPEGKGKALALLEVQERYIPKLILAIESFRVAFD